MPRVMLPRGYRGGLDGENNYEGLKLNYGSSITCTPFLDSILQLSYLIVILLT